MTNEEAKTQLMCLYAKNLDTASEEEQEALDVAMLSLSAWGYIVDEIKEHMRILYPWETQRDAGEEDGCRWCLELIEESMPGVIK